MRRQLPRALLPPIQMCRRRLPLKSLPPPYRPAWPGTFEKWATGFVKRNHWRVQNYVGGEDDALQECGIVFARCSNKYGDVVDNDAWFMSLYMRAVSNYWCRLAERDGQVRQLTPFSVDDNVPEHDIDRVQYWQTVRAVVVNEGPFRVTLVEASRELSHFMRSIIRAPTDVLEFVLAPHPDKDAVNARLNRMFGRGEKPSDLLGQLGELTVPT